MRRRRGAKAKRNRNAGRCAVDNPHFNLTMLFFNAGLVFGNGSVYFFGYTRMNELAHSLTQVKGTFCEGHKENTDRRPATIRTC